MPINDWNIEDLLSLTFHNTIDDDEIFITWHIGYCSLAHPENKTLFKELGVPVQIKQGYVILIQKDDREIDFDDLSESDPIDVDDIEPGMLNNENVIDYGIGFSETGDTIYLTVKDEKALKQRIEFSKYFIAKNYYVPTQTMYMSDHPNIILFHPMIVWLCNLYASRN